MRKNHHEQTIGVAPIIIGGATWVIGCATYEYRRLKAKRKKGGSNATK